MNRKEQWSVLTLAVLAGLYGGLWSESGWLGLCVTMCVCAAGVIGDAICKAIREAR